MQIELSISPEDLESKNRQEDGTSKRVCIGTDTHIRLKQFAAGYGVSMRSIIECFVEKLPKN